MYLFLEKKKGKISFQNYNLQISKEIMEVLDDSDDEFEMYF